MGYLRKQSTSADEKDSLAPVGSCGVGGQLGTAGEREKASWAEARGGAATQGDRLVNGMGTSEPTLAL